METPESHEPFESSCPLCSILGTDKLLQLVHALNKTEGHGIVPDTVQLLSSFCQQRFGYHIEGYETLSEGTEPPGPQCVCSRDVVFRDVLDCFEKPSTTQEARGVLANLAASLVERGVDHDLLSQTWRKLDTSTFSGLEVVSDVVMPWDAHSLQLAAAIAPGLKSTDVSLRMLKSVALKAIQSSDSADFQSTLLSLLASLLTVHLSSRADADATCPLDDEVLYAVSDSLTSVHPVVRQSAADVMQAIIQANTLNTPDAVRHIVSRVLILMKSRHHGQDTSVSEATVDEGYTFEDRLRGLELLDSMVSVSEGFTEMYWDALLSGDVLRRLAQLVSASDPQTRLGTAVILLKLAEGSHKQRIVDACFRREDTLPSLVQSLQLDEPMLPTVCAVLARLLIVANVEAATSSGIAERLVMVCEQNRADSQPFILALHCLVAFGFPLTEEDAESIPSTSTFNDLQRVLAQELMQLMTADDEEADNITSLFVQLGAVPAILRFLCGGLELSDIVSHESPRLSSAPASMTASDPAISPPEGCEVPADTIPEPVGVALESPDGGEDEENDGNDDCGDDEDDDEEAEWELRRDIRYISAIVLDRMSQVSECEPHLANVRVLAHLSSVLRENRLHYLSMETDPELKTDSDLNMLRLSSAAVCRLLSVFVKQQGPIAAAVRELMFQMGGYKDIVELVVRYSVTTTVFVDGTSTTREDDDAVLEAGILLLGNLAPGNEVSPEYMVALSTISDCLQSVLLTASTTLAPSLLFALSQLSSSQDTAKLLLTKQLLDWLSARSDDPSSLHITFFTLIAALCRSGDCVVSFYHHKVLAGCLRRMLLTSDDPHNDLKIRGEIALVIARSATIVLPGSTTTLSSFCLHSVDSLAGSGHRKTIVEILLHLLKSGGKRNKRPMMHACQALIATSPESLSTLLPEEVANGVCGLLAVCDRNSTSRSLILTHSVRLLSLLSKQFSAKDWLTDVACDVLQCGISDGLLSGPTLEDASALVDLHTPTHRSSDPVVAAAIAPDLPTAFTAQQAAWKPPLPTRTLPAVGSVTASASSIQQQYKHLFSSGKKR